MWILTYLMLVQSYHKFEQGTIGFLSWLIRTGLRLIKIHASDYHMGSNLLDTTYASPQCKRQGRMTSS